MPLDGVARFNLFFSPSIEALKQINLIATVSILFDTTLPRGEKKIFGYRENQTGACCVPSKPDIHCAIASRAGEGVHNLSRSIQIL